MAASKQITLLDSTLRDGAQAEDISFSVRDKLAIARLLDELGVPCIEAGNPGSNPKDLEFFARIQQEPLRQAKLCAFGSTCRRGTQASEDPNLASLLQAHTPVVSIFGKAWDFHATDILHATLEENLRMIADSIRFLKSQGKEVVFDAEHFFDGYKENPSYAMQTILTAQRAGADSICLCETNGGAFPDEVSAIVRQVCKELTVPVGIHTHDDGGMAVANSILAVKAGATQVQGTMIGFGERCGNANLSAILANLQLKRGYRCIPPENLPRLMETCRAIAEVSNLRLNKRMPYVGKSAFAHKGGMHIDGVSKASRSFEHIDPEAVGNARRFLVSEVAGRSTLLGTIQKLDPSVERDSPVVARIIAKVKEMEHDGYQFEGADATLELLMRRELGMTPGFFRLENFKTIGEQQFGQEHTVSSAMVKVFVDGEEEITAAEGNGPVNALDGALRKALERFYPQLRGSHLIDYKVRVLDGNDRTGSRVRVLIDTTDGRDIWSTVGVSCDIIEASLIALADAVEYKLIHSVPQQAAQPQ